MAIAMELVAQVRDLLPQRLIILQHALHHADERRDEGHDRLESPPIGRRDVLPVKVGKIYVKPFECRWGWFDRRGSAEDVAISNLFLVPSYLTIYHTICSGSRKKRRADDIFWSIFLGEDVEVEGYT